MSTPAPRDSLYDLERHRIQLEQNVEKLDKALCHWRLWDAEYESLKEELDNLPPDSAANEAIAHIHSSFQGDLLRGKNLDELLGDHTKTPEQITDVLDHRIEYVTRNIKALEKQLEVVKDKLARVTVVSDPENKNDEGEPIMDIFEQLDDDDNVISSRVQSAGGAQADAIASALEKAGVLQEPSGTEPAPDRGTPSTPQTSIATDTSSLDAATALSSATPGPSETTPEPPEPKPILKNKSVSFAEDTKPADSGRKSITALRVEQIMKASKDQEQISTLPAVIPKDESAEDAFLRQQMLRFGKQDISELGAVVAELTLADDGSDVDNDDQDWDEDDVDEDEEEEYDVEFEDSSDDENQWGMSTRGVLTPEYLNQMKELEQRLTSKQTPAPAVPSDVVDVASELQHTQPDEPPATNTKKAVKFAPELDIAPDVPQVSLASVARAQPFTNLISDVIVERSPLAPASTQQSLPPEKSKRVSRFKQTRGGTSSENAPKNSSPLADRIIERNVSSTPKEPDEFDEAILRKEAAVEYSKMRTSFIQRQGGFLQDDTSEIQPLDEAEGGARRVSRFKAARLSKQ